jgi:transcriptional regulator with XRE-family HTH domain
MAARTPKYTPERDKALLDAVQAGLTYELSAALAGISEDTLARWRQGKSGAPADFAERFAAAEAKGALANMLTIRRAAQGVTDQQGNLVSPPEWRAAAWILEHRYPQQYGRTVQEQQHSGPGGGPIEFASIDVPLPPRDDDEGVDL